MSRERGWRDAAARLRERIAAEERRLVLWANSRHTGAGVWKWWGWWLRIITHAGGAIFTLAMSLLIALTARSPWNAAGWQSLTAVVISHIPVYFVKRKVRRLRPYQALKEIVTGTKKPLSDPSFPSGHTTAIFAFVIPMLAAEASLLPLLLPAGMFIAVSVAWSRIYLGLHYPSDVAVGAMIGTVTALIVTSIGWMPVWLV